VEDQTLRLAIIAGASHALKFKEEHPHATDKEALKHVAERTDIILGEIEED